MKKMVFFLLIIGCLPSTGAWSQKVTLSGKGLSLEKVFEQIKAQTGYDFVYNQNDIDQAKKVDLQVKNASIKEVLDQCLLPQGFTYEIRNKIIGIRRPAVKKPSGNHISIKGLVIDTVAGSTPLPDASILIEGSQTGVRSDRNGYFTLEDIDPRATLLISYAGYRSREMTIDKDAEFIYAPLEPGDGTLDEVQTIAYGKVSTRFNTGNVSTVKGSDLAMQPVGNTLIALQGLVPGLAITQLTGAPGGGISVQLRGKSTIQSKTDPLYVIDGIPYDPSRNETFVAGFNSNLAGGSMLNMINPSDIESIDVLKDADATAIYGSQGANGIILITTKKGRPGPARFTLDVYSGLGAATTIPHYLGLSSYLAMRHEALRNDSAAVAFTDYDINGTWDTTRYTNWLKVLMGQMVRTNDLQGQLTGGNNNINYFAGAGFYTESTVYPGNGGETKGSVHWNVNGSTPDKKLDLQLTGSWLSAVNTVQSENVTPLMATAADAPPAYLPNDSLNWQDQTFTNPLAPLTELYNNHSHTLITSALLTFHVLRGLELKVNVGYNQLYHREFQGTPATTTDPWIFAFDSASNFRSATFYHDDSRSWIIEPQANFTSPVGKGVLTALAGASYWHNTEKSGGALGFGFPSDPSLSDLSKATMITPLPGDQDDYKYNALFGRLNYNWKSKYIASFNGRYDGSSRFGPDRQYHFFGSVAAVWIFTAEPFLARRLPWLSFGKLRASYGATGNDRIQGFLSQGTFDSTFNTYQGVFGLQPASLADPDISWESTRKMEIGLDLGFGRDRFLLNANYYRFRSSDLLLDAPLSAVTGLSGITENLPIVVGNEGLELALQSINIKRAHFSWTTSAMLTIPRNKLIRFDNLEQTYELGQLVIGDPLNILHTYRSGGVDPQTGLYRFVDSSGNYTSQPQVPRDLTAIVRLDPSLYGSVTNRYQYKSFILEILIFYNRQVNTNPNFATYSSPGIEGNNVLVQTANARWRYPGQTATIQRYGTGFASQISHGNAWSSNLAYSNAAYIRCKNVYLAYQFPATVTKKMHMNNFTCYIKGQNLFTISPYKDYDPETGINIAPVRLVAAGLKAGF
jgi:TonB-linked SusC/RagA family outer membrane protein